MNVNQETGELINSGRSPRFSLWVAFLVFATITMGSAVGVVSSLFHDFEDIISVFADVICTDHVDMCVQSLSRGVTCLWP